MQCYASLMKVAKSWVGRWYSSRVGWSCWIRMTSELSFASAASLPCSHSYARFFAQAFQQCYHSKNDSRTWWIQLLPVILLGRVNNTLPCDDIFVVASVLWIAALIGVEYPDEVLWWMMMMTTKNHTLTSSTHCPTNEKSKSVMIETRDEWWA